MRPGSSRLLLLSLVGLTALLYLGAGAPGLEGARRGDEARVLIFVVGDRAGVDLVRSAVASQRIVVSTPDVLALREGRMVVSHVEAAGGPLRDAGWLDRPVEIFRLESTRRWREAHAGGGASDPERVARLRELVHEPTLSAAEQLLVLQAMNEGVEF